MSNDRGISCEDCGAPDAKWRKALAMRVCGRCSKLRHEDRKKHPKGGTEDPWSGVISERAVLYSGARGEKDERLPLGAEPWEWRPYRQMSGDGECECMADDGVAHLCRPMPPVYVHRAPPPKPRGKGSAIGVAERHLEFSAALEAAALTTREHDVLRLARIEGRSRQDIAADLGCSGTAVKRTLERASRKIRDVVHLF